MGYFGQSSKMAAVVLNENNYYNKISFGLYLRKRIREKYLLRKCCIDQ